MKLIRSTAIIPFVAAFQITSGAWSQCTPIDFENFAVGTVITTQYPGVTFSVVPNTCGGSVDLVIGTSANGTSSGTQALVIETGCPDFSPDYLRMVFDNDQSLVEFILGEPVALSAVYDIRAYNSGGTLLPSSHTLTSGPGIHTFVRVGSNGGPANIARIEIQNPTSFFEAIDDLSFGADITPPIAEIDSPTFLSCACGVINIVGTVDEPDGTYERDWLHYRPVNADPIDPWILIGSFTSPFTGTLYSWDTSLIPHGTYFLRLTVRNECGMESSDVTAVRVDHNPPSINLTSPTDGESVCGMVEFEGSVTDPCMSLWTLEYAVAGTGNWVLINSSQGSEFCTLGLWDTVGDGIADGNYDIRITADDVCGNNTSQTITIVVDNSSACGCTADINGDGFVNVTDLLILLGTWGPVVP